MNFYEDEEFEQKIEQITDQFGYLLLDIIFMSFQKINSENQILKEFLDDRLQVNVINLTTWFIVHIECPSAYLMIALEFATGPNGFSCRNKDGMQLRY